MAACSNCAQSLEPDARFCGNCGTPVPAESQASDPAAAPTDRAQSAAPQTPQPVTQPQATSHQPQAPTTDGMAIASVVVSAAGFFTIPVVLHIVGIILGVQSRKRIRESAGTLTGQGLATAGIWVGIAGIVLVALVVIFLVAFFSILIF